MLWVHGLSLILSCCILIQGINGENKEREQDEDSDSLWNNMKGGSDLGGDLALKKPDQNVEPIKICMELMRQKQIIKEHDIVNADKEELIAFQMVVRLDPTGVCDPKTKQKLEHITWEEFLDSIAKQGNLNMGRRLQESHGDDHTTTAATSPESTTPSESDEEEEEEKAQMRATVAAVVGVAFVLVAVVTAVLICCCAGRPLD